MDPPPSPEIRRWKLVYYATGTSAILLAFLVLLPHLRTLHEASPALRWALSAALVLAVGAHVLSYLWLLRHLRRWWWF